MKSRLLKSLSIFLVVIMLFSAMPVGTITASAAGKMTLAQLQTKFPNSKYWNVDGNINKKDSLYLKQFLAGLDVELGA